MWDFVTIVQVNILLLSDFLEEVLNQIILKAESEPMLQNDAEIKFLHSKLAVDKNLILGRLNSDQAAHCVPFTSRFKPHSFLCTPRCQESDHF